MAILKNLDVIAITDHNNILNLDAFDCVAKEKNILFIPGIEIQTIDDIHIICLFENLDSIKSFYDDIKVLYTKYPHNEKKFGNQLVINERDEIISSYDNSLLFSMDISLSDLFKKVVEYNGLFIPAHVDKSSYSIISQLGFIPNDIHYDALEIKYLENAKKYSEKYRILINSDAHRLEDINERINSINVEKRTIQSVFQALRGK
ncbi:MAG: PHP domain-containing protein [Desulfurococcales archaeon]|nr:PHP domain-containing protein [Desulfurococcales archaeon]